MWEQQKILSSACYMSFFVNCYYSTVSFVFNLLALVNWGRNNFYGWTVVWVKICYGVKEKKSVWLRQKQVKVVDFCFVWEDK